MPTVTFNSNSGTSISPITVAEGSKISKPTAPTRSGYVFDGWYKESSLANEWIFADNTVFGNITLYAEWTPTYLYLNYTGTTELTITDYTGPRGTSVSIPALIDGLPVTVIEDIAFYNNNLTSVTIPDSVTSIGNSAFYNNNLTSVTIPNSVTLIRSYAFQSNQLINVTIGNNVTTIMGGAFCNNQLTSITIGNSVTSIGNAAFWDNKLTNVTIPDSVTSIAGLAFLENQLTSITFEGSGVILETTFTDNIGNLITAYTSGGAGTYTRPNTSSTTWTKQ